MNLEVGVLREGLATLVAGVLDDLVVHLVLVSVEGVLGGEDPTAKAAVQLLALLMDGLNVSLEGFAVTVNLQTLHLLRPRPLSLPCCTRYI